MIKLGGMRISNTGIWYGKYTMIYRYTVNFQEVKA